MDLGGYHSLPPSVLVPLHWYLRIGTSALVPPHWYPTQGQGHGQGQTSELGPPLHVGLTGLVVLALLVGTDL